MENTDNIINIEIKPKKVYYEAQKKASRAFHDRNKDNEEYKQKKTEIKQKKSQEKDKERIIARVRANQRHNQEIEQLERLHELIEQGLITFEKLSIKDNHELLHNLEILGM